MQFSPEVGRALYKLIEVAERKGRSSDWWRKLVEPLVGVEASSFKADLGKAVGP